MCLLVHAQKTQKDWGKNIFQSISGNDGFQLNVEERFLAIVATESIEIRRYHQRRCLETWHINSAHAPLNRDDGGLLPDAYLHLINR